MIEWNNIENKPDCNSSSSINVLTKCENSYYVCSYITDENSEGRFYIDMKYPRIIFCDVTEYVEKWAYIN